MTYDEFLKREKISGRGRKKLSDEEHRIQCSCVRWFRYAYPAYGMLLYAVPNGGRRDSVTGAKLKAEGVIAGVSDLNMDVANRFYHGLRIEMKTRTGKQRESQQEFQKAVEAAGYKYVVCRSVDEFVEVVKRYMEDV